MFISLIESKRARQQSPRGMVHSPIAISDRLPPIDLTGGLARAESPFTIGGGSEGSSAASTNGGLGSGAPYSISQVEKPTLPRPGNPFPKCPSMMKSSRVERTVLAQFVVDTLSRAVMSTCKILDSSNDFSLRHCASRSRIAASSPQKPAVTR